jgi:hypothetical protein
LIAKQNDVFRSAFKQSARGKILLSSQRENSS